MALRVLTASRLERLISQYQAQLRRTNGTGGEQLARVARRVEGSIVRELLAQSGDVNQEQITRLLQAIRRIVIESDRSLMDVIDEHVPRVYDITARRVADTAIDVFGRRDAQSVLDVFENWERAIDNRTILSRAGSYTERWRGEWSDEWTKTARTLQARFTRAAVTGESWSNVAKSVTSDVASLDIQGRMNSEDYARAFVRTKFTELSTDAGLEIAREAGLDLFVNVGVPDSRQSQICFEASQEGPHTLEWWESSQYGVPPRHVMNCRCTLLAVPKGTTVKQNNPKFEEVAA